MQLKCSKVFYPIYWILMWYIISMQTIHKCFISSKFSDRKRDKRIKFTCIKNHTQTHTQRNTQNSQFWFQKWVNKIKRKYLFWASRTTLKVKKVLIICRWLKIVVYFSFLYGRTFICNIIQLYIVYISTNWSKEKKY